MEAILVMWYGQWSHIRVVSSEGGFTLWKVEYNMDIMLESALLVVNPITFYSYGFLFNCTMVGQASDSMKLSLVGWHMMLAFG